MPCSLFKEDVLMSDIPAGTDTSSTHQASTDVAHYVAIEVGHHHHIKLVGIGHQL